MKKLIIVAGIGASLLFSNVGDGNKQENADVNKNVEIDVTVDAIDLNLHVGRFFEQPDEN